MLTRHQLAELNKLPPSEQERIRREEIAKQRELRLKQRALRREAELTGGGMLIDENSQSSSMGGGPNGSVLSSSGTNLAAADFNIRNYFLMHKVLNKILLSKYAWPFKDPVTEEDAPNYSTIITVITSFRVQN